MSNNTKIVAVQGKGIVLRGNDIDTDRIIPARYLRTVSFDGLGEHAFEDDRAALKEAGKLHPFDDERYFEAEILCVNKNFGCGSSREHAPQSIMRWKQGIKAVVGESFAEIFYGNCLQLGIVCPVVSANDAERLMKAVEADPSLPLRIDLEAKVVRVGDATLPFEMPESARRQFLQGRWDSTSELLEGRERILSTMQTIPYLDGFAE